MTPSQQPEHLFELVHDSVMTRTLEGRINFWNCSAEQLYGWRKEEAVGRVSHNLLQTQFPKPLEEIQSELVQNGVWEGKLVHTTRAGGRVVVESRWTLELEGQSGAVVEANTPSPDCQPNACIDKITTARKQAHNLLQQTMALSQQPEHLFELVHDSVMTRTLEGRINFWNCSAEQLYGWRKEEAVGRVSHNLLQTQFPKPLEEIQSELVRNGVWEGKLVHTTRDGARVVVESRWTLDLRGQSGVVVEANTPSINLRSLRSAEPTLHARDKQRRVAPSKFLNTELLAKIANVLLAEGAFLCILVSLYIAYHYEWTAERRFSDSITKVVFYFIPLSLTTFLFASLTLKPSYKINFAIVCVSLAVSVFGMEVFLQSSYSSLFTQPKPVMMLLANSNNKKEDAAKLSKEFGLEIDARTAGEIIADLRKKGVDAVPIIAPANHLFIEQPDESITSVIKINGREVMPLGGISNKVTVLCNENGQWINYQSDEGGFNNPNEIWRLNRFDIAALGDSFAHGYCVPADKQFVALIRQRYPATLNLGIAGDGPLLMLAKIKEYLQRSKPKIVLWFYYEGNDLTDLQTERKSGLLMNYLKDGFTQKELSEQTVIDRAIMDNMPLQKTVEPANLERRHTKLGNLIYKLGQVAKLAALRQTLGIVGGADTDPVQMAADLEGPNMDVFRDILSQAKTRVDAWGGRLYFVYLPEWARYTHHSSWGKTKRSEVLSLVSNLGIPIVDIDPAFQSYGDPLSLFPFRGIGHYNEPGHRLVAEEVLRVLSSSNRPDLK